MNTEQASTPTAESQDLVRRSLGRIQSLPALSNVVTKIISLADDPMVSGQQVADVVEKDQSMVAVILKIVNSPFYGLNRRVSSIHHAIVLLGYRAIRNVALSTTLLNTFRGSGADRRFHRKRFWRHSVGTATAAKLLARRLRRGDAEEAFLAGLIHDMGRIILDHYFSGEFTRILDLRATENVPLLEAERRVVGLDHAEIGGLVARQWNFPPQIADAIGFHHRPADAQDGGEIALLVQVADALSHRNERMEIAAEEGTPSGPSSASSDQLRYLGNEPSALAALPGEDVEVFPDAAILDQIGLTPDRVDEILVELEGELEKARVFLNVLKS